MCLVEKTLKTVKKHIFKELSISNVDMFVN